MLTKSRFLFFVLFIEGAALMAVELMGAKLLAPFYGSSLYVWTTVLVTTIAGLTLGYYSGGLLSQKRNSEKKLVAIISIATLLVFALPYSAALLIYLTSGFSLIVGIFIACALLIVPPLLCFGMVGPMIVRLVSARLQTEGTAAGTVYFTSTLGGILATFLFGYYLIPCAGLRFSALATGLSLASIPIIYFAGSVTKKRQEEHEHFQPNEQAGTDVKEKKVNKSIYLYAILEGAAVMATELMAARMMAPYFGSSLFVWAAVIGFTLAGLATGYYLGGKIAHKYDTTDTLQWIFLAASVLLMIMHFTSQQLTLAFESSNFNAAIITVSFFLVAPPLILLGMAPTLLIKHITTKADNSGAAAGNVYAISSVSGIASLILFGFYVIPEFGLTAPCILTGIAVGLIPLIKLISGKKYLSLFFIVFVLLSWSLKKTVQSSTNVEVQYYSEGLLGQVLVADLYGDNENHKTASADRMLFVNRIGETAVDKNTGIPRADYIIYVSSIVSNFPEHSKALLLGLGGGSIANLLQNNSKFNVDAIELDERVAEVSREYFSLNKDVNVVVDDARHYIEQTSKKYDVIFFDVFRGDIPPSHVLSLECFKKAKSLLNKNGVLIVNFYGFLTGDIGKAGRSVYKTLCASGFNTKILPTNSTGSEEERNILFVAGMENEEFKTLKIPLLINGQPVDVDTMFIKIPEINNAIILTDDKPVLDRSIIKAVNNCRAAYNASFAKRFSENGIPLFE